MKKYFIVTDIHSFYDEMIKALNTAGFDINNPEHIFVSLGDLLDRGEKPLQCLQFVNNLPDDRKILIRGNHEDLIEAAIARKDFKSNDYSNGTAQTVYDLGYDYNNKDVFDGIMKNPDFVKYINSVIDYYDDGKNVFVHGWIPCTIFNQWSGYPTYIKVDNWKEFGWQNARWINGMDAWDQGVKLEDKTIYCGHWHTSWGHSKLHNIGPEFNNYGYKDPERRNAHFEPFVDEGIVALDACTAYSHIVNCYVVEVNDE